MSFRSLSVILITLFSATNSNADFQRWSSEVDSDPFTGGEKVFVSFSRSINSNLAIKCDTSKPGIEILTIPGWKGDESLRYETPTIQLAIDKELLFEGQEISSSIGLYGQNNLAGISAHLTAEQSEEFIVKFASARSQIAMKDGRSNGPMITTARGSTKASGALTKCLGKQNFPVAEEVSINKEQEISLNLSKIERELIQNWIDKQQPKPSLTDAIKSLIVLGMLAGK